MVKWILFVYGGTFWDYNVLIKEVWLLRNGKSFSYYIMQDIENKIKIKFTCFTQLKNKLRKVKSGAGAYYTVLVNTGIPTSVQGVFS